MSNLQEIYWERNFKTMSKDFITKTSQRGIYMYDINPYGHKSLIFNVRKFILKCLIIN